RGRARNRPGRDLSRHRAEIEGRLQGLWGCDAHGEGGGVAAAAKTYSEFADQADEVGRLWFRLRIRPRRAGRLLRTGLFSGSLGAADLLRSTGSRLRARN